MFWHRCVCSVCSWSIKCEMKYVEISEAQNVDEAGLFFGRFSRDVTFQLSRDLKRGRGQLKSTVFSFSHMSGKVSRFYIFLYFHCEINLHGPLCWQLWWLRYCRFALYEVWYCYDLCCALGEKREKKNSMWLFFVPAPHTGDLFFSLFFFLLFLHRVQVVWVSFQTFSYGTFHVLSLLNGFFLRCVKHGFCSNMLETQRCSN